MSDEYRPEQENKKQPEKVRILQGGSEYEVTGVRIDREHSISFQTGEVISKSIREFIAGILAQRIERSIMHGLDLDLEGGVDPNPPSPPRRGFFLEEITISLSINADGEIGIPTIAGAKLGAEGGIEFTLKRKE